MPRYIKGITEPWYIKLLKKFYAIYLQIVVIVTFVGILPTFILAIINMFQGNYLTALVCSCIATLFINANKSVQ